MDLPGRRHVLGDLTALTVDSCAAAVAGQILGDDDVTSDQKLVLIGHSLAGVLLSDIVNRLPAHRVAQVVFVACCVPAPGQCVIDMLPAGLRSIVRHLARRSAVIDRIPPGLTRYAFGNRASAAQRDQIASCIVSESSALLTERVTVGYPEAVRKSWILTAHDRALPARKQSVFIENVGGVNEVVAIDAGHEVMFTHPTELAETLVRLVTGSDNSAQPLGFEY